MLIQCSSCGAQAKLPDSKEGAKVRCPSCSHVYVARPRGARAAKKEDPTKYFIIGGAVLALIVVLTLASRGGDPEPVKAEETVKAPPPAVDEEGWDSPAVKLVRSMHEQAAIQNKTRLQTDIDPELAYAWTLAREDAANDEADGNAAIGGSGAGAGADDETADENGETASTTIPEGASPGVIPAVGIPAGGMPAAVIPTVVGGTAWSSLGIDERNIFLSELVDAMVAPDEDNYVASWKPFDGRVISFEDGRAHIRLSVTHRDPSLGLADRSFDWKIIDRRAAGASEPRWKAYSWERWISPEEMERQRSGRTKKTVKRTLSDGSYVIEGEIRAIPFDDDVSKDIKDRVNAAIATLVDLESGPRQLGPARRELTEIGKPAIPALLTKIAETVPLDTEDEAIQMGLVHQVLGEITGYVTTFKPHVALGATEERMDSGLKQWFGWYDRKYKKFTGLVEEEDPLFDDPDWQPRTARERIEFEKARLEREKRKSDG